MGTLTYVLVGFAVTLTHRGGIRYDVFLGRWWYNTAILFLLGYLFGRKETEAWAWMKGSYRRQAACSVIGFVVSFLLSLVGMIFPLGPAALVFENLATVCFTWLLLLFFLRRNVTSRLLSFYGGLTLELYLMHGFFVNLFYQLFYDKGAGILTIGNPPIYILRVLACGTALALLFKQVTRVLFGRKASVQ